MLRRTFIKTSLIGTLAGAVHRDIYAVNKSHILTLSFDDGFKKSFLKIADIFESYDLQACLNVIASGHLPEFKKVDDWILPELMGDFNDWNALAQRGHEIMPHSWKHLNLAKQPLDEAKELIDKCLIYFENNLNGYRNETAIFNFPFNASTPELEKYLLAKVGAVRSWGTSPVNGIPTTSVPFKIGCGSKGPNNIDRWVGSKIEEFLAMDGGWLVLNLHGLDDEGWGPISTDFLTELLSKLVQIGHLEIAPAGQVLQRSR